MINASEMTYYLTRDGAVHAGDDPPPPDGSTLLVAPGCQIEDALARKHGIDRKIAGKSGEDEPAGASDGAALVTLEGGRAIAAGVLADDDPRKQEAAKAARATKADDEDDEDEDAANEGDHVAGKSLRLGSPGVEDKAVAPPARSHKKK